MKSFTLLRLTLDNFKGVKNYTLEPDGSSVMVSGTNGTGKTTLFDAYSWLLFGKDSAGHSDSAFDVKPYGEETPTVTVEGVFRSFEGDMLTLRRQLTEKIVRQRGTDETSIKNEYKFFVDDVPKTKTQYDGIIAELCPPASFRMVSDPDYFAGKLKWDERRSVLTQFFGSVDEQDLLERSEEWKELNTAADGRSVSDYRAIIAGERKKVKAELDAIPDRIAEAELAIPTETAEFDPVAFKAAEEKLKEAEQRITDASNGTAEAQLKQQVAEAKASLQEKRAEYIRSTVNEAAKSERSAAEHELYNLKNRRADTERDIRVNSQLIEAGQKALAKLREQYQEINSSEWNKDAENCPYCGQPLPPEKAEKLRSDFFAERSFKLEQNIASGKSKAAEIRQLEERSADLIKEFEEINAKIAAAEDRIKQLNSEEAAPPFEQTAEYVECADVIKKLEDALADIRLNNAQALHLLVCEADECRAELAKQREYAAGAAVAERQKKRIAELKEEGRTLGRRAAELDRLLDMAARFEQYKLSAIEENVNSQFEYAKFKLFDRQLNGGYSECCEVVVDGAPYSTNLNPGKKINAGLDIIRTLSEAIGFSAPVWIDNSESYVKLMDIGAQVIALRVDENAHELTVSVQDRK